MSLSSSLMLRAGLVSVVAVAIVACGPRAHCRGEHAYLQAESVSILEEVDNIRVPRSSGALLIPAGDFEGPAYAEEYEDERGRTRIRCLDTPPPLPELVEAED